MQVNRGEAHDRLEKFKQDQLHTIEQGLHDCVHKNPLSLALQEKSPYIYVYGHARQSDCGLYKRVLWQPRLTKPEPYENSYLFRVRAHSDEAEICWILPPKYEWRMYQKGSMMYNEIIDWSINMYKKNRKELGAPFPDDLPDAKIEQIYELVRKERAEDRKHEKMFSLPEDVSF